MNDLKALKSKVLELKETLFGIESILEDYENHKITQAEELFYKRLKLPSDANVLQFFDQFDVNILVKVALLELYKEEYPRSFREFQEKPARLPREMRAFNGFIWLKNIEPSEVLRYQGVGRKGVSSLEACIQKLENMLAE